MKKRWRPIHKYPVEWAQSIAGTKKRLLLAIAAHLFFYCIVVLMLMQVWLYFSKDDKDLAVKLFFITFWPFGIYLFGLVVGAPGLYLYAMHGKKGREGA